MKFLRQVGVASRKAGKLVSGGESGEPPVEEDVGGFGPPGGILWTTPLDVMSDRPKSAARADEPVAEPAAPAPGASLSALGLLGLASTDISSAAEITGFLGACLVDSDSGFMLASAGDGRIDLEAAAALNTQVVKAEQQVIEALGLEDVVEDILITMNQELHFMRPLEKSPGVFLYVALDKRTANLGMARMQVKRIESLLSP